jgi:hypothetical protein
VVVESRAHGSRPSDLRGRPSCDTLVVGQRRDESPIDVARRVLRTLSILQLGECTLQQATLFVAPGFDDAVMTARHVIARALVQGMRHAGEKAELLFVVDGASSPELRHALMALVDILVVAPGASSVPIRIRFEGDGASVEAPARESGIRLRAVKVRAPQPEAARAAGSGVGPRGRAPQGRAR